MISQVLIEFLKKLNYSNANYLVLRNYEKLPHDVGNDLDILVDLKDVGDSCKIIKESFSQFGFISKITPLKMNGVLCKGIKINEDGSVLSLSIHLQYWVSCEINKIHKLIPGLSYKVSIDQLQKEIITQDGCDFYIPCKLDLFGLILRQVLYKAKPEYKILLKTLSEDETVKPVLKNILLSDYNISEIIDNKERVNELLIAFVKDHWGNVGLIKNYGKALSVLFVNKYKNKTPVFYITGPDGAGKTSVSTTMAKVLDELGVKYKHVYSIKRNIFKHIIFFIRRKIHGTSDNKFSENPSKRKFRFILTEDIVDRDDGSLAWRYRKLVTLMISAVDVFINYLAVLFFKYRNNVVIVETSPYDIFIKYHMPKFIILEKLISPLIPAPDKGILLKADAIAISTRKLELTAEEVDDYYLRLDSLLTVAGTISLFDEVRTDIEMSKTKNQVYKIIDSVL